MSPNSSATPAHPLDSFFSPGSIAIIGASRDATKIPGMLLAFLRRNGYAGGIYPVNPRYDEIDGLPCFPSIAAIGHRVDLAIVVIPAQQVLAALEECAAAGVRNAVVISSGFAEGGGDSAGVQRDIADLARRTGMRVSGPNAEGFYNEIRRVAATFSPTVDVRPDMPRLVATRRRIGIVAQSGGIGFAIYNRAKAMGVAVSYVMSTGNEADLATGEVMDYLVQDAATDVILLFIEGIRDVAAFEAAARRAAEVGKPVIVAKVGRTSAGERAAASHTASMAGWNAAYDAVFAKYGLIAAHDIDEAVAIAAAFASNPWPRGDRVAVVTVSGGAGAWVADTLAGEGLSIPELSPLLQSEIQASIPSYGSPRNPVDITAQAVHSGGLQRIVERLTHCDEIDLIVVVLSLSSETRMPLKVSEIKPVVDAARKPILIHSYTLPSQFARDGLGEAGIVVFSGLAALGRAAGAMVRRAAFVPVLTPPVRAAGEIAAASLLEGLSGSLSEYESKQLLRDCGIAMPREVLVRNRSELPDALAQIGFPLVMKIQSRSIAHKSEVGGVKVDIRDVAAAERAYDELLESARRHCPDAHLLGVLVGPMAQPGVEMIVGTVRDATFGPMIMVGLGGIATELFRDVVYRPAPVSPREAEVMIGELKSVRLLHGFRGAAPADIGALAHLIAQVSQLAASLRQVVAEIEINPVVVHRDGEGVAVLDALMVAALPAS
ncbi:acetate--CoA ligase family protein [Bradyrhizobium sp. U87765 SZCCT0131]|uniref:acetate--CoA ligase family protein n=1 Tax=unclassified Bradyrhizobium TaxID=2631580 RepID=UPI001BA96D4B|nr:MULTISPECIES: acetate--CoA ligase family protein [unclassified Bradyrhizobium]MBR1217155.1 acetate--CoA ligase family protein [Bradyrhizobium sp. U87765 SZCCT0131]MBR1259089.1 acetate--CoA ligase family protein [Bradyrhizobium sp. U87765 SZCCT0134]MBR1305230.1 acetate--CoA ligase family protein [Bradyrhizobium sp. U87765 SZCCT0110]MBR1321016.1 acetate--CoA ligase family protein [Bradyrhizobium sp. U87765 SZCCT0109]MBR1350330.1 acetate--CoA ligase family protein [Bradyrhizobium sp. U87765 SZ